MKLTTALLSTVIFVVAAAPLAARAEGDWKKGRIYYRMVCTACHTEKTGAAIPPVGRTKADWNAYLSADKHAKGKDSFKYYISQKYRESIKDSNKAAAKFVSEPDDQLMEDVRAFIMRSAKDGEVPASCS